MIWPLFSIAICSKAWNNNTKLWEYDTYQVLCACSEIRIRNFDADSDISKFQVADMYFL
jgi:hypothetical protein